MKRYLHFPSLSYTWNLTSPQYVICGSPLRFVTLNPTSNASTFLWEQIEPDPLINAVTITPNNTSKDIVVAIPVGITTNIVLKVTLNGDTNNSKLITIIPFLIDNLNNFSRGNSNSIYNNTLNDPINYQLVPIVSDGPQAIFFTSSSQQTGVRFLSQSYRNSYIKSITINNSQTVSALTDSRIKLNINTSYSLLKNWYDIKVLSQPIEATNRTIDIIIPTIIADEIVYNPFNKGNVNISSTRTPYSAASYNLLDPLITNFNKGNVNITSIRTPFTAFTYNQLDLLTNNFNKGNVLINTVRTPYTSNIIG